MKYLALIILLLYVSYGDCQKKECPKDCSQTSINNFCGKTNKSSENYSVSCNTITYDTDSVLTLHCNIDDDPEKNTLYRYYIDRDYCSIKGKYWKSTPAAGNSSAKNIGDIVYIIFMASLFFVPICILIAYAYLSRDKN